MKRLLLIACMFCACAQAAGTVTDTNYVKLTRSGLTLTDKTTPKLACPVTTKAECEACKAEMIKTEKERRTSGYVTYRCEDIYQSFVKFSKTAPAPPVIVDSPTPVAHLQVYACSEQGADGRILESITELKVTWPNCSTASFQDPSRSLVVAVNPGSWPFYWEEADATMIENNPRVFTRTNGVSAWVRAKEINWPAAIATGRANLRWTPPTTNTDGTPLDDLAGYRIFYGTSENTMTKMVEIKDSSASAHVIDELPPATYYFGIKAYNSINNESPLSKILVKAIQ